MSPPNANIEAFFRAYARRSNDALQEPPNEDIDGVVQSFAPYFVGSGPQGVMGGANDSSFRKMIPEGNARYRQIGGKAFRLTRVETTELDGANAMATVDWEFDYIRPKDHKSGTVKFTNRYFLNLSSDTPKIFAYITPDEEQAMKDHGLV